MQRTTVYLRQKELYFRITHLPARLVFKLWKMPPDNRRQKADFEFVIELH